MVISPDGRKAFIAVPKTGSNSVRDILIRFCGALEISDDPETKLRTYHRTAYHNFDLISKRTGVVTPNLIRSYGFLRDPVDRWCSAVNFYWKHSLRILLELKTLQKKPHVIQKMIDSGYKRFHDDIFVDIDGKPSSVSKYHPIGSRRFDYIYTPDVKEELANLPWEMFPVDPGVHEFFYPQYNLLNELNTVILDYSKFELEVSWLVNKEWLGKMYYEPDYSSNLNKSSIKKNPVSDKMRKKIREAYDCDYKLTPHTIL